MESLGAQREWRVMTRQGRREQLSNGATRQGARASAWAGRPSF